MTTNTEALPEPDRSAFERHWLNTRRAKKSAHELQRHALQPQTYVADNANRHWVTWQAATAHAAKLCAARDAEINHWKEAAQHFSDQIGERDAEIERLRGYLRKSHGHAAGNYMNKCLHCGTTMEWVDKRCYVCTSCADKAIDAAIKESKS